MTDQNAVEQAAAELARKIQEETQRQRDAEEARQMLEEQARRNL